FFSSSRAGWIGTAAGFVVLGYIYCVSHHITFKSIWDRVKAKRGVMIIAALSGAVVLAGAGYILYRQTIHPTHASLIDSRLVFWSTAIKTIGQNLLIGQGPYTFVSAYVNDHSVPYYGVYMHAHSLPLTITSETGLLGLAASLMLLATGLVMLWKRFTHALPENLPVIVGALAALCTASIHSLFDSFVGKSLGSWVIVIAVAVALSIPSKSQERSSRPWFALIVVLALWGVVWVSYPMASAQQHAASNDWQPAVQDYREAVRRDAFSAATFQQLALAESMVGDDLNLAINTFKETIRLDPSWALNHANLGALYLARSDSQNAIKEFKIASDKSPDSYMYSLNYGLAAEMSGDSPLAVDAYKNVLRVMPELANSSFWQGTDFRKQFIADWLKEQPVIPVLTRAELETYARNFPYDTRYYNELAMLAIKEGSYDRAQYWIDLAGLVGSDSIYPKVETAWMRVELAAAQGDINKAVDLGRIIFQKFVSPGTSGPGDSEGSYYTGSAFRTPAMSLSVVPQMVTPMPAVWEQRFLKLNDWIMQTQGRFEAILPELLRLAPELKLSEK
ncbi:MAG: hypothetical protein HGA86_02680, partial [Anaerolineaceae bacterium]|nr:hypothetical protein [Anaerolineaceae bacterium]